MPSGQQPIPHDIKVLTNPAGRKIKDRSTAAREHGGGGGEVPSAGPLKGVVPSRPASIADKTIGARYWEHYWTHAGNWLANADYPLVERLCVLHNVADQILKTINEDGMFKGDPPKETATVKRGPGRPPKISPTLRPGNRTVTRVLVDWQRILAQMERIEDRLGLNPVERSRIRIQVKEHESALDRWRSDRTGT